MTLRRVAYVLRVFPKISETFIVSELAELRRRGVEVRILSLRPPAEALRHALVEDAGLTERTLYDPEEFPRRLREFQPEILHAHFATAATTTTWRLAPDLPVPLTFTSHGYDDYR